MQALYRGEFGLFLRQKVPPDRGYVAADIPHELWENLGPFIFNSQQELSEQLHALHCAGAAFCFCAQRNSGLALDLKLHVHT